MRGASGSEINSRCLVSASAQQFGMRDPRTCTVLYVYMCVQYNATRRRVAYERVCMQLSIMSRESSSGREDFSRTPHVSDSEISSDDAGELGARPYMFEPWRNKYYLFLHYLFLHVRACPESKRKFGFWLCCTRHGSAGGRNHYAWGGVIQ